MATFRRKGGRERMARIEDVEFKERMFLRGYPFRHYSPRASDPVANALTPLQKPLAACTVALLTTAGLSLPDQEPFDLTIRNGDSSFREIPSTISPQLLEMHQRSRSFDHTGVLRDRNLALPLDRLREMQQRGEISRLAPRCYSFMGSIVGPSKLMRESAPEVARRLKADGVDVALLTPV